MNLLERLHRALNYDFCPSVNRWVYWMKHPLAPTGLACVAAGLCGVYVNPYALVLLAILLGASVLGIFWPIVTTRGIRCEARFTSSRCRVGEAATVRLCIRNRWPWPIWGLIARRGFADPNDSGAGVSLARVGGWSEAEFEWVFRPHRRGVFPMSPPEVETGFPFGLILARAPIAVEGELLVWPKSIPLTAMPDAVEIHSREDRYAERQIGNCGDILGTRAYREGDSLRRVHWAQTAKYDRMIVTERQAPAMCAVLLQVDVNAASHRLQQSHNTLETTLSVAASVLESLHRQHAYVEVLLGDVRYSVGASAQELRLVLDAMARVPQAGETHARGLCRFDRPSRLLTTIVVTTDVAFQRHREHQHGGNAGRYVIVRSHQGITASSDQKTAGCDCHAWIDLSAGEPLDHELPVRWKEACSVA